MSTSGLRLCPHQHTSWGSEAALVAREAPAQLADTMPTVPWLGCLLAGTVLTFVTPTSVPGVADQPVGVKPTPQPRMRMAWPPIISPETCWYTPEGGGQGPSGSAWALLVSHSSPPAQLANPTATDGARTGPGVSWKTLGFP